MTKTTSNILIILGLAAVVGSYPVLFHAHNPNLAGIMFVAGIIVCWIGSIATAASGDWQEGTIPPQYRTETTQSEEFGDID